MRRRADLALTAVVFAIGAWYFYLTQQIRHGTVDDPLGERGLPTVIAVLVMAGAVVLAIQQLRSWNRPQSDMGGIPDDPRYPASAARSGGLFLALLLYVYLLPWVGYFPATLLFMALAFLLLQVPRTWKALAVAVLYTAAVYFLFTKGLQVTLPAAELGQ